MAHEHVFRWKYDRPPSLEKFQTMFPDDWSCAVYLAKKRWPEGFVCPHCGSNKGWKLRGKPWVWECGGEVADEDGVLSSCRKQTSVIAHTIMHKTHLPLRTWFLAAHLVATHSNGISALQLQGKLGIGSYKTAWLLLHKLRRAMVDPGREPLGRPGRNRPSRRERDAVSPPDGPAGRRPRPEQGRQDHHRWRGGMSRERQDGPHPARGDQGLRPRGPAPFVLRNTYEGSVIMTDGNAAYRHLPNRLHDENVLPKYVQAHHVLKHIHRVFSNLKRWTMGVYHGLRRQHANIYLQEFVFRWNRRRHYRSAFDRLLGIGMAIGVRSYWDITGKRPVFREVKKFVRDKGPEDRQWAYEEALDAGVDRVYAKRLLDPHYPPEPEVYIKRKPQRPALAKRRTAFVFDAF